MKMALKLKGLALALCLASLASCGETAELPSKTSDTEDVPNAAEVSDAAEKTAPQEHSGVPEDLDLGGETVHLWYTTNWINYTDIAGEETGDVLDDAVFSQNLSVQEKLNCTIDFFDSGINQAECAQAISQLLLANDASYDIYCATQWSGALLVPQGLYMNIAGMPYIGFDKPWWDLDYMNAITVGNDCVYTLIGDFAIDRTRYLSCCYYNKQMYQDYYEDADGMYRTVLDGNWTYDKLCAVAKDVYSDLNGNGKMDLEDTLCCTLQVNADVMALQYCTGIPLTARDENNRPYLVADSERMNNIIADLYKVIYETPGIMNGFSDPDIVNTSLKFSEGTMMFLFGQLQTAEYLRDMPSDYGVIPTPKYNSEQEEYHSFMFEVMRFMALPYNCQIPEDACAVLEEMAFTGYEKVRPVYCETVLKNKYARDDITGKMIDLVRDGLYTDIALVYCTNFGQTALLVRDKLTKNNPVSFSSLYAKVAQKAEKEGESLIEQFLENRD